MQRQFPIAGILLTILGLATPAYAQTARGVPAPVANGHSESVMIAIYPGHGTTLNFRPTGEPIRKVWLDDPSQVTLDFDDRNCLGEEAKCAASVIHLRRIKRLNFPDLPISATTSLTVLTDRNLYRFHLTFPDSGRPRDDIVDIQPNDTTPEAATTAQINGPSGGQLLERGLQVAASRRLITQGDDLWNRVRSLLLLVRQGMSVPEAAQQVGVSQALLARLAAMGQSTHP